MAAQIELHPQTRQAITRKVIQQVQEPLGFAQGPDSLEQTRAHVEALALHLAESGMPLRKVSRAVNNLINFSPREATKINQIVTRKTPPPLDTPDTIELQMNTVPNYQIIRSPRQTISLHITPEGELLVHAPRFVPKFFIDRFVSEKQDWITKKLHEVRERPQAKKKELKEGEIFWFLGKEVQLNLTTGIHIQVREDELLFPKVMLLRGKKELENWYMAQAKEIITKRLNFHAEKMHATYKSVFFSDTKSKWGTCFQDNSLQFNWRLVMAPLLVIDYVVIHELTHTTEKSHSRDFWSRVRLFTPAYRQHREWLNKNGHLLKI